jgi:hypothetical protein
MFSFWGGGNRFSEFLGHWWGSWWDSGGGGERVRSRLDGSQRTGFSGARVRCWKGVFSEVGRVRVKGDFTDSPRKIEATTVVGWVVDWQKKIPFLGGSIASKSAPFRSA